MTGVRLTAQCTLIARLTDATGAATAEHTGSIVQTRMIVAGLPISILGATIGAIAVSKVSSWTAADDRVRDVLTVGTGMTNPFAIARIRLGLLARVSVSRPANRTPATAGGSLRVDALHRGSLAAASIVPIGAFINVATELSITWQEKRK